ncbi:MAG: TetR/AcrR family transcriptional regulator [Planctomycetota bacterium]
MNRSRNLSDKRRDILAAAAGVFDAHGYSAATIDQVASGAGIAKGSIYNYFRSKQDLFMAVFDDAMAVNEAVVQERLASSADPVDQLLQIFDHWYDRHTNFKKIGRLVLECWASAAREDSANGQGAMTSTFESLYVHWRDLLAEIITQGQQLGKFQSDLAAPIAASVIMATLDGITLQAILGVGVVVDDDFLQRLKRGFLAALGAAGQEAPDNA